MSLPPFEFVDACRDGAFLNEVKMCVAWITIHGNEAASKREKLQRIGKALDDPVFGRGDALTAKVDHDDLEALEFVLTLMIAETALKPVTPTILGWLKLNLRLVERRRGVSVVEHLGKIQ